MFILPMLLETVNAPFTHLDYIFEPKIDGHRLILSRIAGVTRLYTRHKTDCTRQYPELYDIRENDIILDGEVACVDKSGSIDFESVMQRFQVRKTDKVQRLAIIQPVNYVVFDILRYKGEDLRGWPLMKRKELLNRIKFGNPSIATVPFIEREGEQLFTQILSQRMEGMVAKRKESVYIGRRSDTWLKVINWTYVDIVITGWRKDEFGWLAAVQDKDGQLRPAGVIQLGVPPARKKEFYRAIKPFVTGEDRRHVYVQPLLRAKVKIRNWTKAGLLRDAVFVEFIM